MAELDAEILERVARWCAEAGRQTGAAEIRAALGALGWDELLAVRALLADPPPARPLGPFALADLARGAPADVAAERERAGRYRREIEPEVAPEAPAPERVRAPRKKAGPRAAAIVVRRARDRAATPPDAPPSLPAVSALLEPGGRAVLERLVRRHGARRALILAELGAGWRRDEGGAPREEDLAALLEEHGLARAFERREHDEVLHAFRAAGGVRARAAASLGVETDALDAIVDRLGARADVDRIRDERRADLRGRATLTDRVHLLLEDPERLLDLGLLAEIEADLAARLPEHVRALRAGVEPIRSAFGRSLSLAPETVSTLEAKFGLALGPAGDVPAARDGSEPVRRPRAFEPRFTAGTRERPRAERRDRGGGARSPGGRTETRDRPRERGAPDRTGPRRSERPRPERPERPRFERRDAPRRGPAAKGERPSSPRDRTRPDRRPGAPADRREQPRSEGAAPVRRPGGPPSRPGTPPSRGTPTPRGAKKPPSRGADRTGRPRGADRTGPPRGADRTGPPRAADRTGPPRAADRSDRPGRGGPPRGGRPRPGGGRRPR
ncbi:Fis family transcriptional regulator [Anaeromyxobacter oryzae]|uniref:Uncharacterized protein n=1 Tax=Anaeromyxobacter oryzae TaxID=2918170 RepID=A0ABN6MZQ5_9BACT|nr:Fis family transcriptional regulator [Anaeromyxobacter oryzae]BDG06413.1 hypothetical protein AMOR_54090 [Anaeromyxobacter oryzae]